MNSSHVSIAHFFMYLLKPELKGTPIKQKTGTPFNVNYGMNNTLKRQQWKSHLEIKSILFIIVFCKNTQFALLENPFDLYKKLQTFLVTMTFQLW